MAADVEELFGSLVSAGETLGSDLLENARNFAVPELRKIAVQIAAIGEHAADFTPAGARALLDMQVHASIGVIVAMTTMTLVAVQKAINAIIDAVATLINKAVGFVLIA